jgi:hypothetical protein
MNVSAILHRAELQQYDILQYVPISTQKPSFADWPSDHTNLYLTHRDKCDPE